MQECSNVWMPSCEAFFLFSPIIQNVCLLFSACVLHQQDSAFNLPIFLSTFPLSWPSSFFYIFNDPIFIFTPLFSINLLLILSQKWQKLRPYKFSFRICSFETNIRLVSSSFSFSFLHLASTISLVSSSNFALRISCTNVKNKSHTFALKTLPKRDGL